MQLIPWLLNQATARRRKPTVVACFSSASTQHFHVGQAGGVVDGDMGFLVTRTGAGAQPAITGDPVADTLKAGQLFGVHVDHVGRSGPLVAPHRLSWLQVLEAAQSYRLENPAHGGERCGQHPGDTARGAALMTEGDGVLQLLWIECPPLGAANTESIHQCRDTA